MKIHLFITILLSIFGAKSCQAQSQLPLQMPENVSFALNHSGAMSRSYQRITIAESLLTVEERTGNEPEAKKWSQTIAISDLNNLYNVFVQNQFDRIKNDERGKIVFDAGSETISLSIGQKGTFSVIFGHNSPLSGDNLLRYRAVRKALFELIEKAKNKPKSDFSLTTTAEAEKFLQGKWRASGAHGKNSWYLEWDFEKGKFTQTGYPALHQTGKYKIISVEKGKIALELSEQNGTFGQRTNTIEILIDSKTKRLKIWQMENFAKVVD